MKTLISIALIGILLLNAFGYYGIFWGLQYKNDLFMARSLDADVYDQQQSITVKVPVSIPYVPDQTEFIRATGKFEHQGQFYRIVKQRYAQDTLTVICVRDAEHEKIDGMFVNYVKTFADSATDNSPGPNTKVPVTFIKDYLHQSFSMLSDSNGWNSKIVLSTNRGTLVPSFAVSINHPPERF